MLVLRSALSVAHVVVLPALPLALGCWILAGEERASAAMAIWFSASLGVLIVGYYVTRSIAPRPIAPALQIDGVRGQRYVTVLVFFTTAFALFHFASGGIPIFSHNIETSRFEFDSSGFFGIPGRVYLYGLPLVAGVALARSRQAGLHWYKDRVTLVAVSVFVVSRLLSGFKGGLLEVLIVLLVAMVLAQGPVTSVAR